MVPYELSPLIESLGDLRYLTRRVDHRKPLLSIGLLDRLLELLDRLTMELPWNEDSDICIELALRTLRNLMGPPDDLPYGYSMRPLDTYKIHYRYPYGYSIRPLDL